MIPNTPHSRLQPARRLGTPTRLVVLSLACAGLVLGCGNDGGSALGGANGAGANGGAGATGGTGATGGSTETPYSYAFLSVVTDPTGGRTSFLHLIEGIQQGDTFSLDETYEFGGALLLVPGIPGGEPDLFLVGGDSPLVRRLRITEEGEPELLAEFSVAGRGIASIFASPMRVFSETEGALMVVPEERIIRFNPTTMELYDEEIPVEGLEDAPSFFWGVPPLDVPGLGWTLAGVYWQDGIVPANTAIVAYDPETRTARTFEDKRCAAVLPVLHDGYIYLISDQYSQMGYINPVLSPKPCVIRFDIASRTFDPDYFVDLDTVVGRPAVGMSDLGAGSAYLRVLDEVSLPEDLDRDSPWPLLQGPYWDVGTLELTTNRAEILENGGRASARSLTGIFEGRRYMAERREDDTAIYRRWIDITDPDDWFEFLPEGTSVPDPAFIIPLQ